MTELRRFLFEFSMGGKNLQLVHYLRMYINMYK